MYTVLCPVSLSHHSAYELFEVYSNHFITCLQVVQGQPLPRSSILKLCGWNDHGRFILDTKVYTPISLILSLVWVSRPCMCVQVGVTHSLS